MWKFINHKLAKPGCFIVIALVMIGVTAGTKLVLGWFHFDEARKEALSNSMGEYVGKGLLGLLVLLGFIFMGFRLRAELRARRKPRLIPCRKAERRPVAGPPFVNLFSRDYRPLPMMNFTSSPTRQL